MYKGVGRHISKLDEVDSDGILFHSFQGDEILQITNLQPIPANEFITYSLHQEKEVQTADDYQTKFETLQSDIKAGQFKKVILSRTKYVPTSKNALAIFSELNMNYDNTLNYVISNANIGTWIAATPELLLSIEKNKLKTMSLAGTKLPHESWSAKEYEEQQLVTDTITAGLRRSQCSEIKLDGPQTKQAGKIVHLYTSIEANLPNHNDWIKILNNLHPTPAVCGIPTTKAKAYIPTLEKYNRKFYTGFIGFIEDDNKNFYVNLRCMELFEDVAKLYVGGGITAQSNGKSEWLETERKSETLSQVLSE